MDKFTDALDTLSEAKSLADALNMAVSDLDGPEEKDALNALARHVSQHIKAAMAMLEEHRKEAA